MRQYKKFVGTLEWVSELIKVPRGKRTFFKKTIEIITPDNQRFFAEVRDGNIDKLGLFECKDTVELQVSLQGSKKGDKRYNNIVVHSITKL